MGLKDVPASRHRPYDALISIFQSEPDVAYAPGQGFVRYGHLWPDRFDNFIFWHESPGVLDEIAEDFETLWPQFDLPIVRAQASAPQIKDELSETEDFLAGDLHRNSAVLVQKNFSVFSGFRHPSFRARAKRLYSVPESMAPEIKAQEAFMADELSYTAQAAAGYDGAFAQVTTHFATYLLGAAHLAPGMRILDIATGTGLVAEAALNVIGPAGRVIAADLSPAMAEKARVRLGQSRNASVAVEDGQALSFPDGSFDAVMCSLGLMFFPNPQRGLAEFHRVLRLGGRAAVSVNTVPERSYNTRINLAIARYLPSLAEAAARVFSLGNEMKLRSLFEAAGFRDVEITTQTRVFTLHSFDSYFGPVEQGAGSPGQAFVCLPEAARHAVREEVRRDLGDTGGPIEVEVEYRFASGRR